MIKVTKELASASNIDAPIFRFLEYDVRGQEGVIYRNCASEIDFVTNDGNLYVPVIDNVVASKATAAEDSQFMLLVSKGGQGIQGVQGKPGKDGKTPSVFARFDGKQMVFYTMEDIDGIPTTKRIAATNDLTGPAWKPKVINDTIVWEKSKDDETPQSIPLDELRAKEAPVLLRVNSDNTKREDETSGPANYIQWKYEGEDYWNNLISISELMNLTLAGVTIFPVQNEETGKVEYHLGHKEVTKATYDSTETGKRIITDVELGEVLFDAGKIPFPEYNYEYDIEFLRAENCDRKNEIKAIQRELLKFVKSVNGIRPDEEGNVEIEIPQDYIKKSDIKFEVREEPDGRFLYMSLDGGSTWTKILEATCVCEKTTYYTVTFGTPNPSNAVVKVGDVVKNPGDAMQVAAGSTVCITATAENYETLNRCYTINGDTTITPELTPVVVPEVKYNAYVVNNSGQGIVYMGTSANPTVNRTAMSNLSDGTTVYVKATRSGYNTITKSGTIEGEDLYIYINADEWIAEETPKYMFVIKYTPSSANATVTINGHQGLTYEAEAGETINWSVSASGYVPQSGSFTMPAQYKEITVTLVEEETPPETTLSVNPSTLNFEAAGGNKNFTVTTNADNFSISEECDWITVSKSNNTVTVTATANTGGERNCNITVTAGDKETLVSVSQAAYVAPEPGTYTVTASTEGSCSMKPDSLTISKTQNGTYSSSLTFEEGTTNTVYVKATKEHYNDKSWTVSVNNATYITLGSGDSDCDWIPETYTLTINSSNTPSGYSIKVNGVAITLTNNKYEKDYDYNTPITITAEKDGWNRTIRSNDVTNAESFNMIKDTSINITWTEEGPDIIGVTGVSIDNCVDSPMYVGDTATLKATVIPSNATNQNIIWESSDPGISITQDGEIKAESVDGDGVTITVTTEDGGFTAKCGPIIVRDDRYWINIYNESDADFSADIVKSNGESTGVGETVSSQTLVDPVSLRVTTDGLELKLEALSTEVDTTDYYVDDGNTTYNIGRIEIPSGEIGTVVATYTIKKREGEDPTPADPEGLEAVGETTATLKLLCGQGDRQTVSFEVARVPSTAQGTIQWLPGNNLEYINFVDGYPTNTDGPEGGNSVAEIYAVNTTESLPGGYETITATINNKYPIEFKVYIDSISVVPSGITPINGVYEVDLNSSTTLEENGSIGYEDHPWCTIEGLHNPTITFTQTGTHTLVAYDTSTGCTTSLRFKVTDPNAKRLTIRNNSSNTISVSLNDSPVGEDVLSGSDWWQDVESSDSITIQSQLASDTDEQWVYYYNNGVLQNLGYYNRESQVPITFNISDITFENGYQTVDVSDTNPLG